MLPAAGLEPLAVDPPLTVVHSRLKKVMVSSKKRPALPRRDFFEEQRRYQCFGKFCLITMRPFSIDR